LFGSSIEVQLFEQHGDDVTGLSAKVAMEEWGKVPAAGLPASRNMESWT